MLWEEKQKLNDSTYGVQGETYWNILTNNGATLRTVIIVCADFYPTVEVDLSERLHTAMSAEIHTFILLTYVDV